MAAPAESLSRLPAILTALPTGSFSGAREANRPAHATEPLLAEVALAHLHRFIPKQWRGHPSEDRRANVHEAKVAIPLRTRTSKRLPYPYELMDSAYDAPANLPHSGTSL